MNKRQLKEIVVQQREELKQEGSIGSVEKLSKSTHISDVSIVPKRPPMQEKLLSRNIREDAENRFPEEVGMLVGVGGILRTTTTELFCISVSWMCNQSLTPPFASLSLLRLRVKSRTQRCKVAKARKNKSPHVGDHVYGPRGYWLLCLHGPIGRTKSAVYAGAGYTHVC